MTMREKISEAADFIKKNCGELLSSKLNAPIVSVVLGSGLGGFAHAIDKKISIPYADIPHWPVSTVIGHTGRLVVGENLLVMQGRVHFYEGYSMEEVTFPIRVLRALGSSVLLVTNASGGIHRALAAGDIVIMEDHINFMGTNPLIGPNDDAIGQRFCDMTYAYDRELIAALERAGRKNSVYMRRGVYIAFSGPSFETPAEIRMCERLGADVVGMSTVPEVIAARHGGMKVCGLSCVSNPAAGMGSSVPLRHEEILSNIKQTSQKLALVIANFIKEIQNK